MFSSVAAMAAAAALDVTVTALLARSTSTLARGSTEWIALVTLRAQPPQAILSIWNFMTVSSQRLTSGEDEASSKWKVKRRFPPRKP